MTYQQLWEQLTPRYDTAEAKAITRMVLEERCHLTLTDIICGKVNELSADNVRLLDKIFTRLRNGEPVQYVLGQATFRGHDFRVGPGVLIPRPETEDLVEQVSNWLDARGEATGKTIVDIGTGSGCIALSIALAHPSAAVTAWDISRDALAMTHENAERLQAKVRIERADALRLPHDKERWDVVVSNPPYVTERERADMESHVLCHEPPLALFVPDDAPLRYYHAIARYAREALKAQGLLAFEINPLYAQQMERMLQEMGYQRATIIDDRYGQQRMALAEKP